MGFRAGNALLRSLLQTHVVRTLGSPLDDLFDDADSLITLGEMSLQLIRFAPSALQLAQSRS